MRAVTRASSVYYHYITGYCCNYYYHTENRILFMEVDNVKPRRQNVVLDDKTMFIIINSLFFRLQLTPINTCSFDQKD